MRLAKSTIRCGWVALVGALLLASPLLGQVQVGDDLKLSATGSINSGYTGTYGNQVDSSHGFTLGGSAGLVGSFYDPRFLSFNVNPFYNQSRSNSNFGSVTDSSGVSLSTAIFSGSHFPGAITYNKLYDGTGNYGMPGIGNFDTHGNSDSVGVSWSELLPNMPTVSVGYQRGGSSYSLYGTNEDGSSNFQSIYLNSNYKIAGFGLGGGMSTGSSNSLIPGVFVGGKEAASTADNTSYNLTVSHALPWNGSFSTTASRSDLNSDYLGYNFNGTIDRYAANAGLSPTNKLHFSLSSDYTDNLSGSIYQALVPTSSVAAGASTLSGAAPGATSATSTTGTTATVGTTAPGAIQVVQPQTSSQGWDVMLNSSYAFRPSFQLQGEAERREQFYLGRTYASTTYGGGVYYTHPIMGGYLGSSVNVMDSMVEGSSQNTLGFAANANFSRSFGAWQVGSYVSYTQNAQTFLVTYTTSSYNFSGNLNRRFGKRFYWNASGNGSRSGLTAESGTSYRGEGFGTGIGTGRININGSYSKSSGNSLASGTGLTATALTPLVAPSLLVLYGGESYSFAMSGSPVRRLTITASYVKSRNDLSNQGTASANRFEQQNVFVQYRLRQIGLTGGYTRLVQGFSASGTLPANLSSFSIGVFRWFNLF